MIGIFDIRQGTQKISTQKKVQEQKKGASQESHLFCKGSKNKITLCLGNIPKFLQSFTISFTNPSSSTNCYQGLLSLPTHSSSRTICIRVQKISHSFVDVRKLHSCNHSKHQCHPKQRCDETLFASCIPKHQHSHGKQHKNRPQIRDKQKDTINDTRNNSESQKKLKVIQNTLLLGEP